MEQQIVLSPELGQRLAAIDIGTNSIRLIIVEALRDGKYRILDEERENVRLGRQLARTGRLDPAAIENSLTALKRMRQIASGFQVREFKAIATCAVREAEDGPEFVARAKEAGVDVEVIPAEEEARLAFLSVQRAFDLDGKNVAVMDIGGGSTEIIFASGSVIEAIHSTPLGAVRLTETEKAHAGPLSPEEMDALARHINRTLRKIVGRPPLTPHLLIGSGGTFTSLAEMVMAVKKQAGLPVRGYEVTQADVHHQLERLRKMPVKSRRQVTGLSPDRADIIVAGLAIIDGIMRRFRVNLLQIHDRGVRDGLILSMMESSLGQAPLDPADRERAIDRFANSCDVNLDHSRHVARIAGEIFAELAEPMALLPDDRFLLETAARLQDVGYLINYDSHHKHSYHLILNSRLPGFRPRELELIANVARYHRGSRPKRKHSNFRQLSAEDQARVRKLAAILRLAGGLDRSHTQQVRGVGVAVRPAAVELCVYSPELPEVDLWGARRRVEFFEREFKRPVVISWKGEASETAPATPE